MSQFPYINTFESIKKRWLIFENKWYRLPDIAGFIFFPLAILIWILVIYINFLNLSNQNDRAFGFFVLPLVVIVCIYAIYRKITETKLSELVTQLPTDRNKKLLKEFLNQQELSLFHESQELVVGIYEESLSFNFNRLQVFIFILSEKSILFTMLKLYSKGNPPVFIDHLFLKRDLSKFFSDKYQ
jgi:hypothetical protein